jgi:hypothetical protein
MVGGSQEKVFQNVMDDVHLLKFTLKKEVFHFFFR